MTRRRGRLVRFVEAAYRLRPSVVEWLDELTSAAAELVPESEAAVSRLLELEPRRLHGYVIHSNNPELVRLLRAEERADALRVDVLMHGPSEGLRRLQGDAPGEGPSEEVLRAMRQRFEGTGVADMHHLTAFDGAGFCISLGFLVREGVQIGSSPQAWARAGMHFAAACRLQRIAERALAELPADGAVLHPDGRVVDADGQAQDRDRIERLREAVRKVDAARANAHREGSARALEVWRGLIDGTWSLVDRHDHDGRRYVVAVPNPATPRDPRGLSPQVAQVAALAAAGYSDKWIAYGLGLARSTVATHLQTALAELGLPSRVALAKAFAPGAVEP
jgi:DNA-binding CsgD family transcriptional regulator